MSIVYVECPECGWDGPHDGFSVNEAECGDCHCEFSYATSDVPRLPREDS